MIFCMGCMQQLPDQTEQCPNCGYKKGSAKKSKEDLEPGFILHRRYILGKEIGMGGFGITYIGFDYELKKKVAIKEYFPVNLIKRAEDGKTLYPKNEMHAGYFHTGVQTFLQEAQNLARLSKEPGIVDIYDYFNENKTGYIVMEYLEGEDYREILKEKGALPYKEVVEMAKKIALCLDKMHRAGMIHCDIAPDNIFLEKNGAVKLLDFGAAKSGRGEETKSQEIFLKHGYAPIEQYRMDGNIGPWTDVYALGAVMYRLLTGKKLLQSIRRAEKDDLVSPADLGVALPMDLNRIIMQCLVIEPENRYQSMSDLLWDLNQIKSAPEPVLDSVPDLESEYEDKVLESLKSISESLKSMPKSYKRLIKAAAIFIIICGIVAVGGVVLSSRKVISVGEEASVQSMTMPNIVGKPLTEAQTILLNELGEMPVQYQYQLGAEEDTVLNQKPAAGVFISEQEPITLIMDGGKRYVSVENLAKAPLEVIGKTPEQANDILTGQGIQTVPSGSFHTDRSGGVYRTIASISTPNSAKAGIIDFSDSAIQFSLFAGTERDYMVKLSKEFKNMKYQQDKITEKAKAQPITGTSKSSAYRGRACGMAFLTKGKSIWDDKVKKGHISYITNSKNEKIKWGAEIDVRSGKHYQAVLSKGVQPLPKVTGKTEKAAKKRLADAGWKKIKITKRETTDRNKIGKVIEMKPKAKTKRKKKKTVTLVVGKAKAKSSNSVQNTHNNSKNAKSKKRSFSDAASSWSVEVE